MALNISLLLLPWPIFLGALILIVAAVIILTVAERSLRKKVILKKEEVDTYYTRKLEGVRLLQKDSAAFLDALDNLAREFFEEEFGINGVRYSQLIEKLREQRNRQAVSFCEAMQEVLYSGEEINKGQLNSLFGDLSFMIRQQERKAAMESKMTPSSVPIENKAISLQVAEKKIEKKPIKNTIMPKENVMKQERNVNQNIVMYLSEGIKRGFEVSYLRDKLLEGGFDEALVKDAIAHLKDKRIIETNQQPEKKTESLPKKIEVPENIQDSKEGMKILTKFFHPRNMELETIKKEVEDRETPAGAEVIEVVPYKEEKIEIKKKKFYPKKEPKSHEYIQSMDDLARIKEKIKNQKESMVFEGYKGAGL